MKRIKSDKSDEIQQIFNNLEYLTGKRLNLYTTVEGFPIIMYNGMRLITIHDVRRSSSLKEICDMTDMINKIIDGKY